MKKLLSLLFVVGMLWSNQALAAVSYINVNYTDSSVPTYTGAGVIGSSGDRWNAVYDSDLGNSISLIDVNGASTGVTVTSNGSGASYAYSTGFDGTGYQDLMKGYLYSDANSMSPATITFSGLASNTQYDVVILSQGDFIADGRQLGVSVNGGATYTTSPAVASADHFIVNQNYLEFSGTTDGSGNLAISYWAAADEANINGIQIAAVPEPGTIVLLGVGGIAVAALKKRKEFETSEA